MEARDRILLKRGVGYTFLLGFFAHGFLLTNLCISHDALFNFSNVVKDHQHQIGLGRVLEPLYREATGTDLLMPWSLGLVAFLWLGLAVFTVCRLFHMTDRLEILLISGIMTVNISVTAIAAGYTPWLAADMLALLLSALCVYFWRQYTEQRRVSRLAAGAAVLTASLAIYQCYIAVTLVLIILLSIQDLLQDKSSEKTFRDGMASVGMIGAGGIAYYFLMQIVCKAVGMSLAEGYYDSVTNLWDNREPVMRRVIRCLKEMAAHFFVKDENIYPYQVIWGVNLLLICVSVYLALRLAGQLSGRLSWGGVTLALLLLVALPFAAYAMRLLNTDVHDLMCYAVWLLYCIPLLLYKWTAERGGAMVTGKLRGVVAALLLFIIFSYVQTDNAVYVRKKVESDATLSLMTEVMEQVDRTQGYVPGETKVTFVGDIAQVLQEVPGTERLNGISGCNNHAAITYETTYQAYFDNVMLRKAKVVPCEEAEKQAEVVKMPGYPQEGYVKKVGDTVVVKWN